MKSFAAFALTVLLKATSAMKVQLIVDEIDRNVHSVVCYFSSLKDDKGSRFTVGMDNAFDSLSLGPTDSYNTLVWDKEEMATGFQCEASG